MGFLSHSRALWRTWAGGEYLPVRLEAVLRSQTEAFCTATALGTQVDIFLALFSGIWRDGPEEAFQSRWMGWLDLLEADAELRGRFQQAWRAMLGQLDSVSLLAEAGIPGQHGLLREITSRIFARLLPAPRAENDTARLVSAVFSSEQSIERFAAMPATVFARASAIVWGTEGL